MDYATEKRLLNNSTALDRYHGFMEFPKYIEDQVEWNISKNEALPISAKYKFCFVMGTTLSTSGREVSSKRSRFGFYPCLACHNGILMQRLLGIPWLHALSGTISRYTKRNIR